MKMDWKREEERAKTLIASDSQLFYDGFGTGGDEESATLLAQADIPIIEEDLGGVPITRETY
jgi:hypothetical protein